MSRGPDAEIKPTDILSIMLRSPDPAFTVGEIAEDMSFSNEGVRHQMNRLADAGYLQKKKVGHRTALYWETQAGIEYYVETCEE
jgi:predicted transcriptional regulator